MNMTVSRIDARPLAAACALLLASCQPAPSYYSAEDFKTVPKLDAHVHLNSQGNALVEQAIADNFQLLTVNVDYGDFPSIDEQFNAALALRKAYPETVAFAASFSMADWQEAGHMDQVIAQLRDAREQGAVAVKVWKNIGMDIRDADGQLLMVDDARLDPVFSFLEETNFPVIGHQGEPHNCWLPLEEMTVSNDRQYFQEHPQYHMFLQPEMPSYDDQMSARDNRLQAHPRLRFVGAHLASLEWNVDELAAFLDKFPLASVDMAARMGQLQYQSQRDRERVRNFIIKYQDRLLYATDLTHQDGGEGADIAVEAHTKWYSEWLYLTGDQLMSAPEVEGEFAGLKLPASVIDKIYYTNAKTLVHAACSAGPNEKGCKL